MKTITVLVGLLLSALPAGAQSKLYTNADLASKRVTWNRTVTPDELAGLQARQFVYVPAAPGPMAIIVRSEQNSGPFGAFAPPIPDRRLDGSLWTDPPWEMRAYVGYGHRGYGAYGPRAGHPDSGRARGTASVR